MISTPKNLPSIRVGIFLTEDNDLRRDFIKRLRRSDDVELVAVVRIAPNQSPVRAPLLFSLWSRFDAWWWGEVKDSSLPDVEGVRVITVARLSQQEYETQPLSSSELAQIRECKLDVLLQLGPGVPLETLACCARYGIWSFLYNRQNASDIQIPIFWTLNAGRTTHNITLHVNRASGAANSIVYSGTFRTNRFSFIKNEHLYAERQLNVFVNCLQNLKKRGWDGIALPNVDNPNLSDVNPHRFPSNLVMLLFLVRWCARVLAHSFTKLYFREQWSIVCRNVVETDTISDGETASTCVVKPPRNGHYADPFLVTRGGRTYLFFEKYSCSARGTICCTELDRNGCPTDLKEVLTAPYHLSYPFVFEWRDETYLIPETWENRTVEVYRASPFPFRWELAGVLLKDVTAADPTILQHNGKLWLFVAGLAGLGTECTELSVFFSDSLFGEWHSHPKNPVVCDVRRARPAGKLFFQNGKLIRPGQDCAERYGHAITLNSVETLSENYYSEVPIASIRPDFIPGCCATHTLNQLADFSVLDAKLRIPFLPMPCIPLLTKRSAPIRLRSSVQHSADEAFSQQLFSPQKKRAISQSPSSL